MPDRKIEREPRPVPEAHITGWRKAQNSRVWWPQFADQSKCVVWPVPEDIIAEVLDQGHELRASIHSVPAHDIIRRAFGPEACDGDHEYPPCGDKRCWHRCPKCGDDSDTCKDCEPLREPATREIEARELREGVYVRHRGHWHEVRAIVHASGEPGYVEAHLYPADGCPMDVIVPWNDTKVTIRADAPAEQPWKRQVMGQWIGLDGKPTSPPPAFDPGAQREVTIANVGAAPVTLTKEPPRPTIRIRAREVVPGMLWQCRPGLSATAAPRPGERWEPITATKRHRDSVSIHSGCIGAGLHLDELVCVQLPGKSPRVCCTCHGRKSVWILDQVQDTAVSEPVWHEPDCPVAPTDRHGGMRVWPVPAGPVTHWTWSPAELLREGNWAGHKSKGIGPWLVCAGSLPFQAADGDVILQAFFHPPTQPEESGDRAAWEQHRAERTAGEVGWDPYDVGGDE